MRRPRWGRRILLFLIALVGFQYGMLTWFAPRFVQQVLQRLVSRQLWIDDATWAFPLTTVLSGIHMRGSTEASALTIQQAVIRPRWYSPTLKTLWIDSLDIHQPVLRLTRTSTSELVWPGVEQWLEQQAREAAKTFGQIQAVRDLNIRSVNIQDGVVEYIDESTTPVFHVVLHHISLVIGPLSIPSNQSHLSLALWAEFVGHAGHAAPVFCSGWYEPGSQDLDASCQLEPLALASFEPYFGRGAELRVYESTLKSTSHWTAKSDELNAWIQLEFGHLTEGDVSIHGRTIIDVKRLLAGQEPKLRGEMNLTGRLDQPDRWHWAFIPGDQTVQQLVGRLLERGVEVVRIPLFGRHISVSIAPASPATMQGIAQTSKEIQEALEILATPIPEPVAVEPMTPTAQPEVTQTPEPARAEPPTPDRQPELLTPDESTTVP